MVEQLPSSYRGSSPLRTYAWLIATFGLFVLLVSGVAYLLNRNWSVHAQAGASFGTVLLLGAVLLRPDAVRSVLAGRPVKYASNALLMTLAFLGILGLVNFLAARHNWEYDLTENGQFTLSDQTTQLLENLDRPVHIVGFFKSGDPRQALAKDYLERCTYYSEYLTFEFHDPNVEPVLARSYKIDNYGLVFVSGSNSHMTPGFDEQAIISGLVRVTDDQQKHIYFVTGHGEPGLNDTAPEGYSRIKQALERENYIVDDINLSAVAEMPPTDSTALILAGARRKLLASEIELIFDWVTAGGRLMILADPLTPPPLEQMLAKYGLSIGNDLVADMDNHAYGLAPTSPLVVKYPFHKITHALDGFLTFFPLARSIRLAEPQAGDTYFTSPIVTTGPNSWADQDPQSADLKFDEGVDVRGPIHIGTVTEGRESNLRLVVFGSAGFVANQNLIDEVANRDLFMNAVNWLTEEENLIAIRPKQLTNRRLFLTPLQTNITIFSSLVFVPAVVLVAGIAVWWKRR